MSTHINTRTTEGRLWLALMLATVTSVGCASASHPQGNLSAPAAPEAMEAQPRADAAEASSVDVILEWARVRNVLAPRGRAFTRQAAQLVGDPTDEELVRLVDAVTVAFDYDTLYRDVAAYLMAEAPEGALAELAGWMEGGATAEIRALEDGYEPPIPLEEYAHGFTDSPPPVERVQLMRGWAEAQQAGEFFVLVQEALREAAYHVAGTLRDDAPAFEPLSGDQLAVSLQSSLGAAVIRFLHGLEPVPDALMTRGTREFHSSAGQWFSEAYALGVAQAIRDAGNRVVDLLASS